jgi:hypothetical protein
MADNTFTPGPTPKTVRTADGKALTVPMVGFCCRPAMRP